MMLTNSVTLMLSQATLDTTMGLIIQHLSIFILLIQFLLFPLALNMGLIILIFLLQDCSHYVVPSCLH
jgi:hypothetical protein